MDPEVVAVLFCLLASAFFSGSETALTALPITRLEALRQDSGRFTRRALDRWAADPQGLLITILIGNNLANVLSSALATRIAYRITDSGGLAAVVGIMTLVILIFGEITPKTIAQRHAQWITARVAPVLYALHLVLTPASHVLGLLTRVLSPGRGDDVPVTEQDLLFMLRLAHRHAQLQRGARLMIESVLRFHQAVARQVMVPRPRVATVDTSWTLEELQKTVAESIHSRFPVIDESPDNIVGVVHAHHVVRLQPGQDWRDVVAEPPYVPESKPLPDLLHDFRTTGQHLAIVLDEFGGFAGVVTLEDILEVVVGEIEDELDVEQETTIVQTRDGWLVPGYLALRRLENLLHRTVAQPEGIDSVGGLAVHLQENELTLNARLQWDGIEIRVTELEEGRPARLLVRPAQRDPQASRDG